MVLFNYSTKELTAKVVYYGPGLCGKTTNLQWIHDKLPIKNKGKMLSLATEADRTLFFDFLPIELGTIRGMKTRIQLYTVPGQVFYNATRRMVLKSADCVIFVCDSQETMLHANHDSFKNMRENLEVNEIDPDEIPVVFQFNKRDLPNAMPVALMNEKLNPKGAPFVEAVAMTGQGVEDTLKAATGLVFRTLATKYGSGEAAPAPSRPPAASPGPPPAQAAPPPVPPPQAAGGPPPGIDRDDLLDSLGVPDSLPAEELSLEDLGSVPMLAEPMLLEDIGAPAPESAPSLDLGGAPEPSLELEPLTLSESPPQRAAVPTPTSTVPVAAPGTQGVQTRPVEPIPVEVGPGQTEVSVPVEISLAPGTTQIALNLRLLLKVKPQR
jgi:small GTP-binding protein